jgi:tellurite resistance protein TerC
LQQRILAWGILGALMMRGALIALGTELIEHYSWVLYAFGAFLLYAGIRMLLAPKKNIHPENSYLFRFARRHLRVLTDYHGEKLFVRNAGRVFATPLFLVLLIVELADVTFALDSIPAVFGITRDPFIVYTSNVFAILGLRALYFLLAGALDRLRYLEQGLAFVLMFVGAKMLAEPWLHISTQISLAIIAGMLLLALLASLLVRPREKK